MFLGKHHCRLDKDLRFSTPDRYLRYLTDETYITQGFDQNLWVLSNNAFQEIYKQLSQMNISDPLARLLFRLILGAATETELSDQEYLKIPNELREYAKIEKDVLLVGQGDYFEIWSPDIWSKQEEELNNMEMNTKRFSTFVISTRKGIL